MARAVKANTGFAPILSKRLECEMMRLYQPLVIVAFLSRHGVKINYVFFKVLMIKYIHQYRKITIQESGRPGPWFYSLVVSINLALVLVIAAIALRKI